MADRAHTAAIRVEVIVSGSRVWLGFPVSNFSPSFAYSSLIQALFVSDSLLLSPNSMLSQVIHNQYLRLENFIASAAFSLQFTPRI